MLPRYTTRLPKFGSRKGRVTRLSKMIAQNAWWKACTRKCEYPKKYAQYLNEVLLILSDFPSMWDIYSGCSAAAKHRIGLLDHHTKPVHSPPYRAEPKTREFENVELDEMIKQKVIESAQAKLVAPIVYSPKNDRILRIYVGCEKLNNVR